MVKVRGVKGRLECRLKHPIFSSQKASKKGLKIFTFQLQLKKLHDFVGISLIYSYK